MLKTLAIRNIVLIKRLELEFADGLGVLTGETGSGKSILLDALGLAIGARADQELLSNGESQGTVVAEFEVHPDSLVVSMLNSKGIEVSTSIILRRMLVKGGTSRAFINDEPVAVTLLRNIGSMLVELHSQTELFGLLDSKNHGQILDSYANVEKLKSMVREDYVLWTKAQKALSDADSDRVVAAKEEEFLRFAVKELDKLAPQIDEENELADQRSILIHGEQVVEGVKAALTELNQSNGIEDSLRSALKVIEKVSDKAPKKLKPVIDALERTLAEAEDAQTELEHIFQEIDTDSSQVDQVEERLFSLRAVARKHGVEVSELNKLKEEFESKLQLIDHSSDLLRSLKAQEIDKKKSYTESAKKLTNVRMKAAISLDKKIRQELTPLKLDDAVFKTQFEILSESEWGPNGCERCTFQVKTNPNTPLGALHKIASGGELARLMLALKVVLAGTKLAHTVIFDEVDSGIGGATAAAVGMRLEKLGKMHQVLVVTHSPQVAAKGSKHWRIHKVNKASVSETELIELGNKERIEEVARMLSGARVTNEARAAATKLLQEQG